jgi:hypothetical protein
MRKILYDYHHLSPIYYDRLVVHFRCECVISEKRSKTSL